MKETNDLMELERAVAASPGNAKLLYLFGAELAGSKSLPPVSAMLQLGASGAARFPSIASAINDTGIAP